MFVGVSMEMRGVSLTWQRVTRVAKRFDQGDFGWEEIMYCALSYLLHLWDLKEQRGKEGGGSKVIIGGRAYFRH